MTGPVPTGSALDSVRVVLDQPQDPVNIAATVRAMKNMGVVALRLVRPVEYDPWRLEGIAHDTHDIIERIEHHDSLDSALADCVRTAAFTARRRAAKRAVVTPDTAARDLLNVAHDGRVALLFGREDRGLSNAALDRASLVVTIPTTGHTSLNLAQAVLIGLYEMHLAAADATRTLDPPRKTTRAATNAEYELLFADAERALERVRFFKTRNAEHVMRSLRSIAFRAAPDAREVSLLRAVAIEVIRTIERISRRA